MLYRIFILLQMVCIASPVFARQKETSIFLSVQGIGGTEMPALIINKDVYLSVTEVFNFLQIRNTLSKGGDSLSGAFITEQAVFLIDRVHLRIHYQGKITALQQHELISIPGSLFMKASLFESVFGLNNTFNFRNLSVNMNTKQELPAIRELRQQRMHENINRLKGQVKADTVIARTYPLFQFGTADWSVIATQRGERQKDVRANLALGGIVAGGEAIVSLGYRDQEPLFTHDSGYFKLKPFDRRQQYYRWRFVNNNSKVLRQIIAGKIFTRSTASIYDPVVGIQLTNTPTINRRTFGSYTLSNFTEPNWVVELYVNNELVDYAKADASGFFTFQVPLVYGNSVVKLRFYGPWGEERSREENISVPFSFIPQRELEYIASAGIVEDSVNSRFGRIGINYGAARALTVGGGVEYLSSVTTGTTMPFVNVSMRLASNLLFSGDYTYGVRARGFVTLRLPSNLQLEANYTRYKKGQKAVNLNYLEERRVTLSRTFAGRNMALYSRITLSQILAPGSKYTTAEWMMSGALLGVGANLTTYANMVKQSDPYIYSNLSLSFRLPQQLTVTPQIQFEYMQMKIVATRCELGKYFFRNGYLNMSWEQNYKNDFSSVSVGIRYDLSFSQISLSASRSNERTTLVQAARGSLIADANAGIMSFNNRTSVGTGGIVVQAFLDLNGNDLRDKGEPKVDGLQVAVNGGRIFHNKGDTSIRVLDMEPYANYIIDLSRSSFENIAWRIKRPSVSVMIDPNRVRLVQIPVVIAGEASGSVSLDGKGLGRIVISIYREDNTLAARVLTEGDGFFSYMGLAPGSYTARIDPAQLLTLEMAASPSSILFHIAPDREGDVVDTLLFKLTTAARSQ